MEEFSRTSPLINTAGPVNYPSMHHTKRFVEAVRGSPAAADSGDVKYTKIAKYIIL